MNRQRLNYILLGILILISTASVYRNFYHQFSRNSDFSTLESKYQKSQYINPDSDTWINDPDLYTYAGILYVNGADPSKINFELQPLTKYFFGISTQIFGNPEVFQLIIYAFLILSTFYLAKKYVKQNYAIIPPLLIALDPLVRFHAHTPYLDLTQTLLITLTLLALTHSSILIITVLIGLVALSKSFMIGILLAGCICIYFLLQKKKKLFSKFLKTIPISIIVYLLGYALFFRDNSLFDFIILHVDILKLYRGYVPEYPKFEIFRIIFTGYWRKWYGDFGLTHVDYWWIAWPISLILSFKCYMSSKDKLSLNSILIWTTIYLLAISLKLVFPRYLLPVLPGLYVLATAAVLGTNE